MPLLRSEAPASIPDEETLEYLLGKRVSDAIPSLRRETKALNELNDAAEARTGLVTPGVRQEIIPGDPHGIYHYWAGNIGHQRDSRMFAIVKPLVAQLNSLAINEGDEVKGIKEFLAEVPRSDPKTLARKYGNDGQYNVIRDTLDEMTVTFQLFTKSVCIINARDMNKNRPRAYQDNQRAKESEAIIDDVFHEAEMPIYVQQYLASTILAEESDAATQSPSSSDSDEDEDDTELWLTDLRNKARHRYWFGMTKLGRSVVREEALTKVNHDGILKDYLQTIRKHWPTSWSNSKQDPDPFKQHLKNKLAVEKGIWTLMEEDILIVTDINNQILFASIEGLAQLLFGSDLTVDKNTGTDNKAAANPDSDTDTNTSNILDLMFRLIDMWSFFTPLPAPETTQHPVDAYMQELHPELDMGKANVTQLQNAKMCLAHYGCWSEPNDRAGRRLFQSYDVRFGRSWDQEYCEELFPEFFQAAMGTASSLIRFLVEPLDPAHYAECKDVFAALPEDKKLPTTTGSGTDADTDKPADFLSLFALGINGYTQRHRDTCDMVGGLAGLCAFGRYTGGNLCLPQLGLRVPYRPGACAIVRGGELQHLVSDYDGTRFSVVGTNHESARRHGLRELGRMRDEEDERQPAEGKDGEEDGEEWKGPCVNMGSDDLDESILLTNRLLHGRGVLDSESSSSTSSEESGSDDCLS